MAGLLSSGMFPAPARAETAVNVRAAPHFYLEHVPQDPFQAIMGKITAGTPSLPTENDNAFLKGLLQALDIPMSSQMLVFSATSLQGDIIRPANPRALYFNESIYLGFVPGGKVEVIALDPKMGGIFYLFDRLRPGVAPAFHRSNKCMNCHSGAATSRLPGLVAESVLVDHTGASLETYRHDVTGHQIPLADRFGGWHVTGLEQAAHHGNMVGKLRQGTLEKSPLPLGVVSDPGNYLLPTSDILPHLIHEHQMGFVNRVLEAGYWARTQLAEPGAVETEEWKNGLSRRVEKLAEYLLFAGEAELPRGGITGSEDYRRDFLKNRRVGSTGLSLKDLDLKTRLFKHRCSYMIYTPLWAALPAEVKTEVYTRLKQVLTGKDAMPPTFAHLEPEERARICLILQETLSDWP